MTAICCHSYKKVSEKMGVLGQVILCLRNCQSWDVSVLSKITKVHKGVELFVQFQVANQGQK
mgnify:CR=1 FL=1